MLNNLYVYAQIQGNNFHIMKWFIQFIFAAMVPVAIEAQSGITLPGSDLSEDFKMPEAKDSTSVKLTVFLEGPFYSGKMKSELSKAGLMPLNQPFNTPPWNYSGDEAVDSIPDSNIVDWVLVDIRSADSAGAATQSTIIARKAGFLMNDGLIYNIDGITLLSFDTVFS
jgi:hypothetical protein